MSLIEEALRRAKEPLLHGSASPAAPAGAARGTRPPPTPPAEPAAPAHSWPVTLLPSAHIPEPQMMARSMVAVALAVLTLAVVFVIGGAFWMGRAMGGIPRAISTGAPVVSPSAGSTPAAQRQPSERPDASPPPDSAAESEPAASGPPAAHHQETPFVLSGVVEGPGESYAMINGTIVGVGERVGDATLLEIVKGTVKLRRANGGDVVLRVPR